jgi:hypothetical protein
MGTAMGVMGTVMGAMGIATEDMDIVMDMELHSVN